MSNNSWWWLQNQDFLQNLQWRFQTSDLSKKVSNISELWSDKNLSIGDFPSLTCWQRTLDEDFRSMTCPTVLNGELRTMTYKTCWSCSKWQKHLNISTMLTSWITLPTGFPAERPGYWHSNNECCVPVLTPQILLPTDLPCQQPWTLARYQYALSCRI